MRAGGGRGLAVLCVAAGILVLLTFVIISRESLLEQWWLWKLRSGDPRERALAIERLRESGGERAARRLAVDLREGGKPDDPLAEALAGIYPRLHDGGKLFILEELLDYLCRLQGYEEGEVPVPMFVSVEAVQKLLWKLDVRIAGASPSVTRFIKHPGSRAAAVQLLVRNWPDSRAEILRFTADSPLQGVIDFCEELERSTGMEAEEVTEELTLRHEKPEVRAIALVHCGKKPELQTRAYFEDPHLLVRRTALRMAASRGPGASPGLDLSSLLLSEKDPQLLREIVEARTVWACADPPGRSFEITGGLVRAVKEPHWPGAWRWRPKELLRLAEILQQETDPALRDAASLALAPHPERGSTLPIPPAPSLKVHEWGVWSDGGEVLGPAEKLLEDLPAFVHRSGVSAAKLKEERTYPSTETVIFLKPVLFFYSPDSVILDVHARFPMGMPWTFYPEATDYLEVLRRLPSGAQSPTPFWELKGIHAPWLEKSEPRKEKELRSRYEVVPWLAPPHAFIPESVQGTPVDLAGVGLEWRGLRIGYGPKLEGEFRPAPAGSWWERLRETPSSPVAIRGEHEQFLFYDGAVRLRAPVLVSWTDASQRALSLRVRSFAEYPPFRDATESAEEKPARQTGPATAFLPGAFVIRKSGPSLRGALLAHLPSEAGPLRVPLDALDLDGDAIRGRLETVLSEQGLTAVEARGLLFAWEKEFFGAEGLRVITVLPGWMYDTLLPIEIRPEPGELVRVGLVWKEVKDLPQENPAASSKPGRGSIDVELETAPLEIAESPLAIESPQAFTRDRDGRLHGLAGVPFPVLSGNGKKIALLASSRSLQVADVESRTVTALADLPPGKKIENFCISHDGNRAALMVREGPASCRVLVADLGGRVLLDALRTRWDCTDGTLSADGSRLSLLKGGRPVVLDFRTKLEIRPSFDGFNICWYPVLSPDGKKLALLRESSTLSLDPGDLLLLDLEAPSLLAVSGASSWGRFFSPGFSSNGRKLLAPAPGNEPGEPWAVLVDVEASRQVLFRCPEQDPMVSDCLPALSADGARALFLFQGALWTIDLVTGISRKAFAPPGGSLSWVSVSQDLKRILYRAEVVPGGEEGLYLLDLE